MNSAQSRADPLVRARPPGRAIEPTDMLLGCGLAAIVGQASTPAAGLQTRAPEANQHVATFVKQAFPPASAPLIIGYGNPLYGDDGIGPYAARMFRDRGFNAIETHQLTPELAERIAAAPQVIFIDCDTRLAPAQVWVKKIGPAPAGPLEHHATPAALLRLALDLYGAAPPAIVVGIGPAACELGEALSPDVIAAVEAIQC